MNRFSSSARAGIIYGLIAYLCWGIVPIYFQQLKTVAALEILAHRIVWSILLMAGLLALVRKWGDLWRVLISPPLVFTLLLSALLLATNWLLYIYATITGRVSEASLGYYMMPLVNAFLGTVVLKERLRPAHYPALALVAIGVAVPFVMAGTFTWIALALPVSFGCYGLVRKRIPVESLTGLAVETIWMFLPSAGYLLWLDWNRTGHFGPDPSLNAWLIAAGVVTVVPLLFFTLSIRRLPLIANSFIQFLSPTMQFLVAVFWIGEPLSSERWVSIGCVWVAVLIFLSDAIWQVGATRRAESRTIRTPIIPAHAPLR